MTETKIMELKEQMEKEVRKQQDLVNIYRQKLLKRETENREILMQLQLMKDWKNKYNSVKQNMHADHNVNETTIITLT